MCQSEIKTNQGFLFLPNVGFYTPTGDLADRFKSFNSLGLRTDYKFGDHFILGLDYNWFFGDNVIDEGIFSNITGPTGFVIDQNGDFAVIGLGIRGNYATLNAGYLFNFPKDEPNSGLLVELGAGFLQHRIDFASSLVTIPQINNEYEKGYDQLTYGLATRQFVGYQYLVNKNRYHFRAGIEFNQGFTQGRRAWDFNANTSGLTKRQDNSWSLKLGVIIPVYTKKKQDEEFFID